MFKSLTNSFSSIFSRFSGKKKLAEQDLAPALEQVEESLLEADVPYDAAQAFVGEVKKSLTHGQIPAGLGAEEYIMKVFHDKLSAFLGGQSSGKFSFAIPSTVLVMGLQGAGKTTTIAKLAHYIRKQAAQHKKKRKILLASVDFYRPAAIDQLEVLAEQVEVDFYRATSSDPVSAAQEIAHYAKVNRYELLFLDTAGRLHIDDTMLEELRAIDKLVNPKYKLLVLDAMTGQESLSVAQAFDQGAGFSGAILSKMDSDTRGGAAFSFRYSLKKPVYFVGTGEKPEDLEQFRPERISQRMLGLGDIMTLVERADEKIKQADQEKMRKSFAKGDISLEDFAQQLGMVNKLGSFSSVLKYLPGGMGAQISPQMIEKGEKEAKIFRAIISSMTKKERVVPRLIDRSRKQRIARGSGVTESDIDTLLQRFQQSKQMLKSLKKSGLGRFLK